MAVEDAPSYADLERENARLRRELAEALEREVEASARESATADILRVIASTPTDLQQVLDAITERAARLCEASGSVLTLVQGDERRAVAAFGTATPMLGTTRTVNLQDVTGRAIKERRTVHARDLADAQERETEFPDSAFERHGNRTVLFTPLMRSGVAVGALGVDRREARPFTDQQIKLLETFANQAAIAIENTRLFQALEDRNRDLSEALKRQTATSEVLELIAGSPGDLQPTFDGIVRRARELCDGFMSVLYEYDGEMVSVVADDHVTPENRQLLRSRFPMALDRSEGANFRRVLLEHRVFHVEDAAVDPFFQQIPFQQAVGYRTVLIVPMLRKGAAIGAIAVARGEVRPFTEQQIKLLESFANQAVIAVENARLFQELQERNAALAEALEQQTATGEILQIIASASTNLQQVLDAVVDGAARLAEAENAAILEVVEDRLRWMAGTNREMRSREQPFDRASVNGSVLIEARTIHVAGPPEEVLAKYPGSGAPRNGIYAQAITPLLRDGVPIGTLSVNRREPRPFSDRQIALIETFANQAVIAIENARLFGELQERVRELQALGEVGQAVSSTLDLGRVLATVVAHADQLSGTDGGVLYEYDESAREFRLRASRRFGPEVLDALQATPVRLGEGAIGRAALTREPIQIHDIADGGAYEGRLREAMIAAGHRAVLAVPLLREDRILGGLVVVRKTPGAFPPNVVELVRTFASQSALAIQNARLYREVEEKSRELAVASQHKSEFLANMSHELRTPLNAIIGFSEVLLARMFGELNEKQEEYLRDILSSGQHLLSLINDILDLSKVEAGRMELEVGEFSLRAALENGLTLLRERAARQGVRLDLEIEPGLDTIQADERKVKQVVFNLLSNAVKFTPAGGRVEVSARRVDPSAGSGQASAVEVAVRDSGIGIAPEDLEHVFEEFRQVGRGEAKAEGTGLGLALARKLVELHGGRIWVESQPGSGSTFTFMLPEPAVANARVSLQ